MTSPVPSPASLPARTGPLQVLREIADHIQNSPGRTHLELRAAYARLDCIPPEAKRDAGPAVRACLRRYARATPIGIANEAMTWAWAGCILLFTLSFIAPEAADRALGTTYAGDPVARLAFYAAAGSLAAVAGASHAATWWGRVRGAAPPRWMRWGRVAPLVPVLFLAPLLGIAAPFGLARGPGAWLVVAVAGALIFAIVLRRPALRAARTLRGPGEGGAAPEAAITADVLGLLTAIDAGRDPWRSAAERGRLAATCTRVARTAERLPDGVRTGSRVVRAGMRAQCAALAAELDRCAGLFAAPDAAAREELQEALARILAAVATGRWGEGARGVAAEARAARRGAAAALAVGVGGAAAGIALGLPTPFTAVFAAVALASIWGVLDPRWGERLREALRIVRGKGD